MRARVLTLALLAGSSAQAAVQIDIDKDTQTMTVAVDGVAKHRWPVSSGLPSHETPSGNYKAFRMEEDHYSKEWDDAPMPHSIFFSRIGHAIHGTDHVRYLGQPASHGCVRLARQHAAQLFALVREHGVLNTNVVVAGVIPPPAVAKRRPPAPEQDYGASAQPNQMPFDLSSRPGYPVPRLHYDPRYGEVMRETYGNGYWVRRRYYRQERPQDFRHWR